MIERIGVLRGGDAEDVIEADTLLGWHVDTLGEAGFLAALPQKRYA
jgi:hypothetical protein